MYRSVLFAFLLLMVLPPATAQIRLSGRVLDAETREPLAFATVGVPGTGSGTLTSESGSFQLMLPELPAQGLTISYLGYQSITVVAPASAEPLLILLQPSVVQLADLVVTARSPEEYIRRVVRNLPRALPEAPFASQSYYREKLLENEAYIAFTEGVFQSYYPRYQDTVPHQHQLVLFRTAENPQQIQFMRSTIERKEARKKAKALKKGEAWDEDEDGAEVIEAGFGGPNGVLSMDLSRELDPFLDSTQFKHFRYSFADPVAWQGRELLVIRFESRGTVEHLKGGGLIYIDTQLDAFAAIDYRGKVVIPVIVQPILLALGLSIQVPEVQKQLRYQLLDGRWYPEYFHQSGVAILKKRHLMSSNEVSKFSFEQLLSVYQLNLTQPEPIEEAHRYAQDKPIDEQAHNPAGLTWETINVVRDREM